MTVAIPRSLGSKELKPLVTTTDFVTLTQRIKAAALLGTGSRQFRARFVYRPDAAQHFKLAAPANSIELCETQLDRYNSCCCWVSCLNPTYKMIVDQPIFRD